MKTIKHYFASANTGDGFSNYFNYINKINGFMYVLKGGPGTGKSTLLKKIGLYFQHKGFEIEFFHCSSDIDSLDGVRICEKNIAIVDGTAPHVTEATIPNINSKIINLGEFIGDSVKKHSKAINTNLNKKKLWFELAYHFIASAKAVQTTRLLTNSNKPEITNRAINIVNSLKLHKAICPTYRELFISAINQRGMYCMIDNNNYKKKLVLQCSETENRALLNEIKNILINKQCSIFVFKNTINSNLIDALYLCDKKIIIFGNHSIPSEKTELEMQNIENKLIKTAGNCLSNAKRFHKRVEKFYIKSMNFEALNKLTDNLVKEIANDFTNRT